MGHEATVNGQKEHSYSPAMLVTGGSGYIGSQLVKHFSQQGETIVSLYRQRLPEPWEKVYPVCSDLSSADLLAAPLRGVHTVVHLAWEQSFVGSELGPLASQPFQPQTASRNLAHLHNLLTAMERAQTPRLIFLSALGVAQQAKAAFLREKYLAEFLVLNSQIPEKIIVRTAVVFGGEEKRDRLLLAVKRMLRFPLFYPLPAWRETIQPVFMGDLVEHLADLVKKKLDYPVTILNFQGKNAYRLDEIIKIVAAHEGRKGQVPLGSIFGRLLFPLLEKGLRRGKEETLRLKRFLMLAAQPQKQACPSSEPWAQSWGQDKSFQELLELTSSPH